MDTLIGLGIAILGSGALGFVMGRFYRPGSDSGTEPLMMTSRTYREPHEHRYDTMLGDGKGWRCGVAGPDGGICNKVKTNG